MNTPLSHGATPVANPLSHAWTAFKTSFDQLWKLYAVGAALLLLPLSLNLFPSYSSASSTYTASTFFGLIAWLAVYFLYTVHLTLSLHKHLIHEPAPNIQESLKRAPTAFGSGLIVFLVTGIQLGIIVVAVTILSVSSFAQSLPEQDPIPTPINTMMAPPTDDQMEEYYKQIFEQANDQTSVNAIPQAITLTNEDASMMARFDNIILGFLGVIAALVLLVPLTWYVLLRLSQALLIAITGKGGAIESVKQSWRLTKGRSFNYPLIFILSWTLLGSIVMNLSYIPFIIIDGITNIPISSAIFLGGVAVPVSVLLGLTILERVKQNAEQQAAATPVSPVTPASPFTPNA